MDMDSGPHAPAVTPLITSIGEYPEGAVGDAAYLNDALHHRDDLLRSSNTLRLKIALQKVYAEQLRQEANRELLRFKLSVMVDMVTAPPSQSFTTLADVKKAATRNHFLNLVRQAGNLPDDFSFDGMTRAQAYVFFDKELGITPPKPHNANAMEVDDQVHQFDPSLDPPLPKHLQQALPKTFTQVTNSFPPNKYYTPRWLVQLLRRFWADRGGIHLDPASSDEAQDVIQAQRYFTSVTEPPSRQQDWDARTLYLNPPFGNGQLSVWVRKFLDTMASKSVHSDREAFLLLPYTGARWLNEALTKADLVLFPQGGRTTFWNAQNEVLWPRYQPVLLYFGKRTDAVFSAMSQAFIIFANCS
jgi:hypothetical protein